MSIFSLEEHLLMAASIIDITPGELIPSSKMRKSAAEASLDNCQTHVTQNLEIWDLSPKGHQNVRRWRKVLRTTLIFYFARQRAETVENDALNLREIAQNVQNSEF